MPKYVLRKSVYRSLKKIAGVGAIYADARVGGIRYKWVCRLRKEYIDLREKFELMSQICDFFQLNHEIGQFGVYSLQTFVVFIPERVNCPQNAEVD